MVVTEDHYECLIKSIWYVKDSILAKSYLTALVDEIVVKDKTATIKGSYAALAQTMQQIKKGNLNNQVAQFYA